jgi:hypothetical protein
VKLLHATGSDEIRALPAKPFSALDENARKDCRPSMQPCDQQRSSVMWSHLFSVLYRLSCRTTLVEIGLHRLAR